MLILDETLSAFNKLHDLKLEEIRIDRCNNNKHVHSFLKVSKEKIREDIKLFENIQKFNVQLNDYSSVQIANDGS